jgi:uncharacterized protein YcbK (DUF882 family)
LNLKTQVHTLIAKSAVEGMIAKDPAAAKKAIEEGEFNDQLTGTEIAAASKKAEVAIRAQTHDQQATENASVKQKRLEGSQALNDLETSVQVDPVSGKHIVPPDYFTKLNDLRTQYGDVIPSGTFSSASNWASVELRRNEKTIERTSDPTKFADFVKKAQDGTLTRAEIYDARANNLISSKDFSFFRGWVGGSKSGANPADRQELRDVSSFVKSFKGYIDTSLNGSFTDTWGKSRFTEFQSDMMQKWQEAKASGMTMEQFHQYVQRALPSYTFTQDDIDKELSKDVPGMEPPAEINAPGLEQKGSIDDFLKNENASYTPGAVPQHGKNIPILTGTQAGRQPLDMSHMNPVVVSKLERVQGVLGYQIPVVSAYRDPARNAAAGGAKSSQHMHGNAVDLDVSHMSKQEVIRVIDTASALGFTGIGVYEQGGKPSSLHLDVGTRRAWGPDHTHNSVPGWALEAIAGHLANQYAAAAPDANFGDQ